MDFEELWLQWRGRIGSYLRSYSTLSAQDRQDISSEAFLRAFQKRDSFEDGRSPGPWLFSIARNIALDYLRKGRGHRQREGREPSLRELSLSESEGEDDQGLVDNLTAPWPAQPPDALDAGEDESFVASYLGALASSEREIANLYYGQDLSLAEIGAIVKIPQASVKWRLYRIRQGLKKAWEAEHGQ